MCARKPLLLMLVLAVCGCNFSGGGKLIEAPTQEKVGPATRDYLSTDEAEDPGYGFYSYLLFSRPPNPQNLARYCATFEEFLGLPEKGTDLRRPDQLNLTYTFVTEPARGSLGDIPETLAPTDPRRRDAASWLATHHDHRRSHTLLKKLGLGKHSGPFLVQARRPLGDAPPGDARVYLHDLSSLSAEKVGEMLGILLRETDERGWNDDALEIWFVRVRDFWQRLGIRAQQVGELVAWSADTLKGERETRHASRQPGRPR